MPYTLDQLKQNVFPGESQGDYNALFGYQNRPGGAFENIRITDMTVNQALAFANRSGQYAQNVKSQIGDVATPMGAFQVVGSTLGDAARGLGLTGNEKMTPDLQDKIGMWILQNQGPQAWAGWAKTAKYPIEAKGGQAMDPEMQQQGGINVDPYANLSKQQRMVLAFSALGDAGQALMGRQGTSFNDTMSQFAEQQDMARKQQAQQAQVQMLQSLGGMGMSPAAGGAPAGGSDVQSQIAAIDQKIAAAMTMIGRVQGVEQIITALHQQRSVLTEQAKIDLAARNAAETDAKAKQEATDAATRQLSNVDAALNYLVAGTDPSGKPIINPMLADKPSRMAAEALGSQDYTAYVGFINSIKSQYTLQGLKDLRAAGVAGVGNTDADMKVIADQVGALDVNNPTGTLRTLSEIKQKLSRGGSTPPAVPTATAQSSNDPLNMYNKQGD